MLAVLHACSHRYAQSFAPHASTFTPSPLLALNHARHWLRLKRGPGPADQVSTAPLRDATGTAQVFDATDRLVVPGLVDTHVHVFDACVPLGLHADTHCLSRGSTTVLDAGSAGCDTLAGFEAFAVKPSKCRVLALLHVASAGLAAVPMQGTSGPSGELDVVTNVDVSKTVATLQAQLARPVDEQFVIGVKIRLTSSVADNNPETEAECYRRALEVA